MEVADRRGESGRPRGGSKPVSLPRRGRTVVAGSPGLRHPVVGVRVAKLQAGSPTVGMGRPGFVVVVMDLVSGIARGIEEPDPLAPVRETAREVAHDAHSGKLECQISGVPRDHEVAAGTQPRVVREHIADGSVNLPTTQIELAVRAIVKFDPLLVVGGEFPGRILSGNGGQRFELQAHHDIAVAEARLVNLHRDPVRSGHQEIGPGRESEQ